MHEMRPVATDVARSAVCVSVCVLGTRVSMQKWLNRSRYRLGLTYVGPMNRVLWSQDRTNPFAAVRDDKSAMRPVVNLLWTLVRLTVANGTVF